MHNILHMGNIPYLIWKTHTMSSNVQNMTFRRTTIQLCF